MSGPHDDRTPELDRALAALPRERQPRTGLEDDIVSHLAAGGYLRSRAVRTGDRVSVWWRHGALAATAALVIIVAFFASPTQRAPAHGPEYLLLLNEDSLYQAPPPGHDAERVAEYSRWADSLTRAGRLVKVAELDGPGRVTGFFIVTASTDDEAKGLAAASPHVRHRGTIDVRKLIRH